MVFPVKDTAVTLLIFLLLFAFFASLMLGAYFLYNLLVPGGRGLIFANPYAAAVLPSLLLALMGAQYRAVHHPGRFTLTWLGLFTAFLAILLFSLPLIQKAPPLRPADAQPLVSGQFLALEDGGVLLAQPGKNTSGQFARQVLWIPETRLPMVVIDQLPYDPLNQRFLLPGEQGGARAVVETGPEKAYFQYTEFYRSIQTDLFAIYLVLRAAAESDALLSLAQVTAISLLFLGLFVFFSLKTWPLVQIILVLVMARVLIAALAYAFQGLPLVVAEWVDGSTATFLQWWLPVFLALLAGGALFFMTLLTKPHRVEALE